MNNFPNSTTITKSITTPTYFYHSTFGKLKLNSLTHIFNPDETISYFASVTNSSNRTFNINIPYCLYINHSITNKDFDFLNFFINNLLPNDFSYNPPYPFEDQFGPFYLTLKYYSFSSPYSDYYKYYQPENWLENLLGLKLSNTPINV